ncbi:hypothetical protein Daus18300_010396 [Diaporthe australafricana]|uniref:Cytochrome P450 n=1 Tax=Diaporthe australafricana TaxID=127596 RepID=A0ABR3WAR3_9PEZI
MDLLTCAALALVNSLLFARLGYCNGPEQLTGRQTFAIIFILQYLSLKYYHVFFYHKYFSPLRHLPGPKDNHWILGQVLNQVKADLPMAMWVKWSREHPEAPLIRYLSLANTEMILVNSLEANRQVLQSQNDFFERPNAVKRMVGRYGGNGLTSFECEEYRAHRKMLSGCFTPDCLRRLEPVFKEKAAQLNRFFDRAIEAAGGTSVVIDCTDTFDRFALDIMGRALWGVDFSYLEHTQFDRNGRPVKVAGQYGVLEAHDAVFGPDKMGKIFTFLDVLFPTRWIPCNTNAKFLRATSWMDALVRQLVANRRKEYARTTEKAEHHDTSRDILSFLIEESMPRGCAEGIQDKNIVGHLLILMVGGHETTAHMLAWSSHVLATRPDIQDRLREDIFGLAARSPDPSFNEIDALSYVDNFVNEVLRVYPPAVWTARQAYRDTQICGTYIPKGTLFEIVPAVTHMNPLIWGDDAAEVNPSRWDSVGIDGPEEDPRSSPFVFEPFTNGPKTCIGKRVALCEIKIALFEMVRRYRFVGLPEGEAGPPFTVESPGIILRPKGMKVRVERIGDE